MAWEDYLNDTIRIQDDDGDDDNIIREVEMMRSNDESNEEIIGGVHIFEG